MSATSTLGDPPILPTNTPTDGGTVRLLRSGYTAATIVPLPNLRWLKRDGWKKARLQQAWATLETGAVEWRDVPVELAEAAAPDVT